MSSSPDALGKIARSICASFLVLVAINAVIWAADQTMIFLEHKDPISKRIPDQLLKYIYPNHSKEEVIDIYNESWNRELVYEEFVQFKEGPFKGKYVNVSEDGFRLVKNQGPWPPDSSKRNIFIFGGSQAFNYGIADEETVASRLQEILRAQSGSPDTCVYNFGRGSYFSTQERILFEQLLLEGHVPDLALFIHGGNDFSRLREDLEFSKDIRNYLESGWLERFMLLVDTLPLMKLYAGIKVRMAGRPGESREPASVAEPADQAAARSQFIKVVVGRANRYLNNIKMIEAAARAYDVQTAFVFAPGAFYGMDPKYDVFGKNRLAIKASIGNGGYSLIKTIVDRDGMNKNFIWMGDLLRGKTEPLFVDTGHYTAKFANEFAGVIVQELADRDIYPSEKKELSSDIVARFMRVPQPPSA